MNTAMPDASKLAALISHVTETMCGISFEPANPQRQDERLWWRIASLPIKGSRPLRVTMSSDQRGCELLGAALFGCAPGDLEPAMIDDSLCELLNMAAGQIKGALAIDQALGLPKIVTRDQLGGFTDLRLPPGVVLRSRGDLDLVLWLSEG